MNARPQRMAKRFELPAIIAALLVVPVIIVEESDLGDPWTTLAAGTNWIIWSVFAAELVAMLSVVPDRRRWLREHPLEVAVVVLTPPFLSASLQAARLFRLLRLVRLVLTARRIRAFFTLAGLRYASVVAVFGVLAGGAAFAAVEERQLTTWDGVWWTITVGCGDLYPKTRVPQLV